MDPLKLVGMWYFWNFIWGRGHSYFIHMSCLMRQLCHGTLTISILTWGRGQSSTCIVWWDQCAMGPWPFPYLPGGEGNHPHVLFDETNVPWDLDHFHPYLGVRAFIHMYCLMRPMCHGILTISTLTWGWGHSSTWTLVIRNLHVIPKVCQWHHQTYSTLVAIWTTVVIKLWIYYVCVTIASIYRY